MSTKFPLRRVALIGGGRWSRVLLPVIQSLLTEDAEILWVTKHGYEHAGRWLINKAIGRVAVRTEMDWAAAAVDAAVVATSPATHGEQVSHLLQHRIPTFCEKPFTLDFEQAVALHRMATEARCPLGVNLEMYFASFVEDFAAAVHGRYIREINITWLDPWSETRYGETKHGDIYTSIVDDMWPHCWSLLRRLVPNGNVDLIHDVRYEPNSGLVHITAQVDAIVATMALSRRADGRVRKIDVNRGEAVLDFGTEPGSTEFDGVRATNEWRGLRPLSRSLSSFFEVVLQPQLSDQWALAACLDAVRSAQLIGHKLRELQCGMFDLLRQEELNLADTGQRNLIVDLLLPEYAAKDRRWPAITMEEQIEFVKHVCTTQDVRFR
ncbi:MAG: Gfo/Idh/MocA family oxidoreductase [Pirellulaceae bacterium]|nr:Gfo/Idh/MocA family oxidoreductase [Pirellulaceae bacterium]